MKFKRLPGTFGVGLIYDSFSRSLVFAPLPGLCYKWEWPRVGACRTCTHGPLPHKATRATGMILWSCAGEHGRPCDCKHYNPETAAGRIASIPGLLLHELCSWVRNG